MSDAFYRIVRFIGRHPLWVSSCPIVINAQITRLTGPFILASNHQCAYDIPILIRHSHRMIDFVSIVEVFRNPFIGWFYGSMNAFPLDRARPDSATVRRVLGRLARGRAVGMFPEGRFCTGDDSMVTTRTIRPGIGRLAKLAGVAIIPCAIIGSPAYSDVKSWLPFKQTRYGIAFGEPILPDAEPDEIERVLIDAIADLHAELSRALVETE